MIDTRFHETKFAPDGRKTLIDLWSVESFAECGMCTEVRMRSGARLVVIDDYEFFLAAFGESVRTRQYLHSEQI